MVCTFQDYFAWEALTFILLLLLEAYARYRPTACASESGSCQVVSLIAANARDTRD